MAVEQLVRAAWTIDAAGDTGNRGDVEDAYDALGRAAADVATLYDAVATGRGDEGRPGGSARCWRCARCAIALLASRPSSAHKPVTSKYTYTEDVYPIVSQHCGACHCAGRRGADVAADVRRGAAVGRVDPARADGGTHAALVRRPGRCGVEGPAQAVAARPGRRADVGDRRHAARRGPAGRCAEDAEPREARGGEAVQP